MSDIIGIVEDNLGKADPTPLLKAMGLDGLSEGGKLNELHIGEIENALQSRGKEFKAMRCAEQADPAPKFPKRIQSRVDLLKK